MPPKAPAETTVHANRNKAVRKHRCITTLVVVVVMVGAIVIGIGNVDAWIVWVVMSCADSCWICVSACVFVCVVGGL